MILDSPELRKLLHDTWQQTATDAISRGVAPTAVAETMLNVASMLLAHAKGQQQAAEQVAELSRTMSHSSVSPSA